MQANTYNGCTQLVGATHLPHFAGRCRIWPSPAPRTGPWAQGSRQSASSRRRAHSHPSRSRGTKWFRTALGFCGWEFGGAMSWLAPLGRYGAYSICDIDHRGTGVACRVVSGCSMSVNCPRLGGTLPNWEAHVSQTRFRSIEAFSAASPAAKRLASASVVSGNAHSSKQLCCPHIQLLNGMLPA
jgi:hypothetical protein